MRSHVAPISAIPDSFHLEPFGMRLLDLLHNISEGRIAVQLGIQALITAARLCEIHLHDQAFDGLCAPIRRKRGACIVAAWSRGFLKARMFVKIQIQPVISRVVVGSDTTAPGRECKFGMLALYGWVPFHRATLVLRQEHIALQLGRVENGGMSSLVGANAAEEVDAL